MSLGIAVIAAWLWFADRPTGSHLVLCWLLTAIWTMTRDSNLLVVGLCAVPTALAASRWWRSASPAVRVALRRGVVGMLVVGLYVVAAQASSDRNRYPTLNVIGQRVLLDDDVTTDDEQWGMPIDDAVVGRVGKNSWDDGSAFLTDPTLTALRDWAETRGQIVHLSAMVRFAPRFVSDVWADLPSNLSTDHRSDDLFGVSDRLPGDLPLGLDGPRDATQLACWALVGAAGLAASIARGRRRRSVVLMVVLASVAIEMYASWLGDSVEVQRHLGPGDTGPGDTGPGDTGPGDMSHRVLGETNVDRVAP